MKLEESFVLWIHHFGVKSISYCNIDNTPDHLLRMLKVWGDSGEEDGTHNRMILTLGFCCTHSLAVWGSVAFFGALRKWKLAEQHRITKKEPDPKIVRELFSEAIADHVLIQWLFIC